MKILQDENLQDISSDKLIGHGKGFTYQHLENGRPNPSPGNNNKAKVGFMVLVEKDGVFLDKDHLNHILFLNYKNCDIPVPTLNLNEIKIFNFSIFEHRIRGKKIEYARELNCEPNSQIDERILSAIVSKIPKHHLHGLIKPKEGHLSKVHDPRPVNRISVRRNMSPDKLPYDWGHLLGSDHICIGNYQCPEVFLFTNEKGNIFNINDIVDYDPDIHPFFGRDTSIAVNVRKNKKSAQDENSEKFTTNEPIGSGRGFIYQLLKNGRPNRSPSNSDKAKVGFIEMTERNGNPIDNKIRKHILFVNKSNDNIPLPTLDRNRIKEIEYNIYEHYVKIRNVKTKIEVAQDIKIIDSTALYKEKPLFENDNIIHHSSRVHDPRPTERILVRRNMRGSNKPTYDWGHLFGWWHIRIDDSREPEVYLFINEEGNDFEVNDTVRFRRVSRQVDGEKVKIAVKIRTTYQLYKTLKSLSSKLISFFS